MKQLTLFLSLIISIAGWTQTICLDRPLLDLANDEPPGCHVCEQTIEGATNGFSPDLVSFDFPCGTIENSQWFKTMVNDDRKITVTIPPQTCEYGKGLEAAIYDEDFNLISNCGTSNGTNESINLIAENLTPGQIVFLMVDGYEADNCEFLIEIAGNLIVTGLEDFNFEIDIESPYCIGSEVCFTMNRQRFAIEYFWIFDSEKNEILSGGGPLDTFACLKVNDFGSVMSIPYNPCVFWFGALASFNLETATMLFQERIICSSDCIQIVDSCYSEEGTHMVPFADNGSEQCDSVLVLTIQHQDIVPSPSTRCRQIKDTLVVEWDGSNGIDKYEISLNRDSFTTTTDNFIRFDNLSFGETVDLKIQPIGICTYLPAEVSCTFGLTNLEDDFLNDEITVYPNPTTGHLTIKTDLKIEEIEIYDTRGRSLQKEKMKTFDLENLKTGIYFLKIKTKKGVGVKRIIMN